MCEKSGERGNNLSDKCFSNSLKFCVDTFSLDFQNEQLKRHFISGADKRLADGANVEKTYFAIMAVVTG